jgi:copper transport protein
LFGGRILDRRTRGVRLLVAIVAAALATVLGAGTVSAHAQLLAVTPGDGEVVASPPDEVILLFNEQVSLTGGSARVLDAAGEVVSSEPSVVDETVVIPLPDVLGDGTYTVTFAVISADSHRIGGASVFHVGAPTPGGVADVSSPEDDQAEWIVRAGATLFTAVAYGGALVAAGAALFLALIARRGSVVGDGSSRGTLVVKPAVLGAAALAAAFPFRVARVGGGLDALGDNTFMEDALRGPLGASTGVTAAALVLLAFVAARPLTGRRAWLAVAVGAMALAGFAIEGHTRSAQPRALMMVFDLTHLAAGAVWIGGIAGLVLAFRASLDPVPLGATVRRFSTAAVIAVVVVGAAGVGMSWIVLPSWSDLTATGYGLALITKVALVAIVVALGAYNRRRLVPAVSAGAAAAAGARRRLGQVVVAELAILLAVVGVTAVLVARSPVSSALEPVPAAAPGTQEVELSGGAGTASISVSPARTGSNQILLELRDANGQPLEPLNPPTVELTEPVLDVGPLAPLVHPMSDSVYHVIADIPLPGTWELVVKVRISDFESVTATTPIEVTE